MSAPVKSQNFLIGLIQLWRLKGYFFLQYRLFVHTTLDGPFCKSVKACAIAFWYWSYFIGSFSKTL